MDNFNDIKTEILRRAHEAYACRPQYGRAYKAETLQELMEVVKDNWGWACHKKVITGDLIEQYRQIFADNDIRYNEDVKSGFLLCDKDATVKAYGNAKVEAYGSATVMAFGNATVTALDNSTVEAFSNATVKAYGNAKVEAYGNAKVEAYDNSKVEAYGNVYCVSITLKECVLHDRALYRVTDTNTCYYANEDMKFELQQKTEK